MPAPNFEQSVFINCPFDEDYDPLLQAILFCLIYLGLSPRLARERTDSGEVRLIKIRELIDSSKYSIHDLSRCEAGRRGEPYRLNMPFELGIDYGCRHFRGSGRERKKILVLEERRYRYQAAISDLAGCDIEVHGGQFEIAIRKVRNWLVGQHAVAHAPGANQITGEYLSFQSWYVEKQTDAGFSPEDILDYSTPELLAAMVEWVRLGRPV